MSMGDDLKILFELARFLPSSADMIRINDLLHPDPNNKNALKAEAIQPYIKRDAPQGLVGNTVGRLGHFVEGMLKGFGTGFSNEYNRFTNPNILVFAISVGAGVISGAVSSVYTGLNGLRNGGKGVDEALDTINDINNPYRRNAVKTGSFKGVITENVKDILGSKGIDIETPAGKDYLEKAIYSVKQMETARIEEATEKPALGSWKFAPISDEQTAQTLIEKFVELTETSIPQETVPHMPQLASELDREESIANEDNRYETPEVDPEQITPQFVSESNDESDENLEVSLEEIVPLMPQLATSELDRKEPIADAYERYETPEVDSEEIRPPLASELNHGESIVNNVKEQISVPLMPTLEEKFDENKLNEFKEKLSVTLPTNEAPDITLLASTSISPSKPVDILPTPSTPPNNRLPPLNRPHSVENSIASTASNTPEPSPPISPSNSISHSAISTPKRERQIPAINTVNTVSQQHDVTLSSEPTVKHNMLIREEPLISNKHKPNLFKVLGPEWQQSNIEKKAGPPFIQVEKISNPKEVINIYATSLTTNSRSPETFEKMFAVWKDKHREDGKLPKLTAPNEEVFNKLKDSYAKVYPENKAKIDLMKFTPAEPKAAATPTTPIPQAEEQTATTTRSMRH